MGGHLPPRRHFSTRAATRMSHGRFLVLSLVMGVCCGLCCGIAACACACVVDGSAERAMGVGQAALLPPGDGPAPAPWLFFSFFFPVVLACLFIHPTDPHHPRHQPHPTGGGLLRCGVFRPRHHLKRNSRLGRRFARVAGTNPCVCVCVKVLCAVCSCLLGQCGRIQDAETPMCTGRYRWVGMWYSMGGERLESFGLHTLLAAAAANRGV